MSETAQRSANSTHTSSLTPVRRVVVNTTSLLTSDVLNRAATFVVYVLVARYAGPRSFGQLSLGLMLLYTFQVFAGAGLPVLITREVAKRPAQSGRYFASASLIALAAFLLSLSALWGLVTVSRYARDTSEVVLLLGLGILPWSLSTITTAILQAWEKMHFIAIVAIPVNVAKIGLSYYLLSMGHGVRSVALVFLGCHFATLFLQWPVLFRYVPAHGISTDWAFCRDLLARAWRFLGIDSLIAVWASINTLLLSWFAGEAAVGLYAAAWQLLVPVSMTFQAVVNGLFPILCRRADDNGERFRQLTVLLLEILTIVAVPGCILLYFGAAPIILALYGNESFSQSALVLRIIIPVLLLQAICNTFGQVLFSRRQEHVTLRIIAADVAFNLLCGTALIYAFGLIGAAVTLLLTWTLNAGLHIATTRHLLADETGRTLAWNGTLLWRIVAAGGIMAGALAVSDHLNFIVTSIVTSLLYLIVLGALIYAACRHSIGIRERFLVPLKEQ